VSDSNPEIARHPHGIPVTVKRFCAKREPTGKREGKSKASPPHPGLTQDRTTSRRFHAKCSGLPRDRTTSPTFHAKCSGSSPRPGAVADFPARSIPFQPNTGINTTQNLPSARRPRIFPRGTAPPRSWKQWVRTARHRVARHEVPGAKQMTQRQSPVPTKRGPEGRKSKGMRGQGERQLDAKPDHASPPRPSSVSVQNQNAQLKEARASGARHRQFDVHQG